MSGARGGAAASCAAWLNELSLALPSLREFSSPFEGTAIDSSDMVSIAWACASPNTPGSARACVTVANMRKRQKTAFPITFVNLFATDSMRFNKP